jgi:adenylate cyclase class 2
MIEAELKARVQDPEQVRWRLDARSIKEVSVYHDTYYDWPDGRLMRAGRELRVRVIERGGAQRCLLTYKDLAVDDASGSKPEHETEVADLGAVDAILRALGFEPVIAFTKECANYRFEVAGRRMTATLVRVPELEDTFLEVETLVGEVEQVPGALEVVRHVLRDLGIPEQDQATELYTDMVARERAAGS